MSTARIVVCYRVLHLRIVYNYISWSNGYRIIAAPLIPNMKHGHAKHRGNMKIRYSLLVREFKVFLKAKLQTQIHSTLCPVLMGVTPTACVSCRFAIDSTETYLTSELIFFPKNFEWFP